MVYEYLQNFFSVVHRRLSIIIIIMVAIFVLAGIYILRLPKLYKATAIVEIQFGAPMLTVEERAQVAYKRFLWKNYIETQRNFILKSRELAKKALQRLAPEVRKSFVEQANPSEKLTRGIVVEHLPDTFILKISYVSQNPELSCEVANAIAKAYVEQSIKQYADQRAISAELIFKKILPDLEQKLNQSVKKIEEFTSQLRKEGIVNLEIQQKTEISRWNKINEDLTRIKIRRLELEMKCRAIDEALARGCKVTVLPEVISDDVIQALKQEKVALETMLANKSQELSRGHPDILNLQAQIDLLDKKIKEHAQGIVKAMKTDLEKIKKQEIALLKEIQKQEKILAKLNAHSINMQNLKNEERTNRDLYSYYFKRYSEMSATSHALPEARILSLAQPPSTHFMPNYFLSFSFVVVLGLFGSICVGFFIDHLDNSFKKPQEIENFYKVPVLARIPVVSAKAQSAPLIFEAGSSAFESIKKLRTELLFKISQDRRVITVISASPAEGKSTVCLNLADAFAREGKKVLLIDGDLRKPHLYKAICESHPKLFGYISGEREIKDCVVATKLDKVDLIGSDCSISSSSEFLGSLGYDNLLKYVRENYDVVIIDSPPLLPSVDSVLHIKKADILILVVRNLFSRRTEAGVVKKQLKNMKISLFGIVISHCPVERPYYYYYSRSTT